MFRSHRQSGEARERPNLDIAIPESNDGGSISGENARQPVSRVLSARLTGRDDHSSGTHLTMRLTRPTRAAGRKHPRNYHGILHRDITAAPIRSCSRWGLPCRPCCQGRGALLPHRFALARGTPCGSCAGGLFSVALSLGSPPPAVSRHRIPVEPGLSSTGSPGQARGQAAAVRPSGGARHVQKKARRQGSTRSHRVLPRPLRRKKPPVLRADRIWFSECVPLPCSVNSGPLLLLS